MRLPIPVGTCRILRSRKAFLVTLPEELYASIALVLAFVLFGMIFTIQAAADQRAIDDVRDITYGNYLANVFLRQNVRVGDMDMSMAEYLALAVHEQGREMRGGEDAELNIDGMNARAGRETPLRENVEEIVNQFVTDNFHPDKCYFFGIYGNNYYYDYQNSACPGGRMNSGLHWYIGALSRVPVENYVTYVAPVDPRDDLIIVYSIYDFNRLLEKYSGEGQLYDDSLGLEAMCREYPAAVQCLEERVRENPHER